MTGTPIDVASPSRQPDCESLRSLVSETREDIGMMRRGWRDVVAGAPGRDWAGRKMDEPFPRVGPVRLAPPP